MALPWRRKPNPAADVIGFDPPDLTPAQREAIEAQPICIICAGRHAYLCPYVQEEEFYENGALKRRVLHDRGALISDIIYLE